MQCQEIKEDLHGVSICMECMGKSVNAARFDASGVDGRMTLKKKKHGRFKPMPRKTRGKPLGASLAVPTQAPRALDPLRETPSPAAKKTARSGAGAPHDSYNYDKPAPLPEIPQKTPVARNTLGEEVCSLSLLVTATQVEELQSIFAAFDWDGSHTVDGDEFPAMWRCLNGNPTEASINARFDECDLDRNKELDFDEFVLFMSKYMVEKDAGLDQIKYNNTLLCLERLDTDGDGFITVAELLHAASTQGSELLTKKELHQVARKLDKTAKKRLTPAELTKWCLKSNARFEFLQQTPTVKLSKNQKHVYISGYPSLPTKDEAAHKERVYQKKMKREAEERELEQMVQAVATDNALNARTSHLGTNGAVKKRKTDCEVVYECELTSSITGQTKLPPI